MSDTAPIGSSGPAPAVRPAGPLRRLWARGLGRMLRLSINETRVATRGFQVDSPQVVRRLEQIGECFAHGYNSAVRSADMGELMAALSQAPAADAGFVFEGAAMGLALTDRLTPGRAWFAGFVAGPAQHHEYMAWVGLGWALARLPGSPARALRAHRSINKWLALDGYGFHEGYFGWRRSVSLQWRPRGLSAAEARVFDQGLGRSLWFVFGARPAGVAQAIAAFDASRHGDLWSGVGLAAAYAGGTDGQGLHALHLAAAQQGAALAQGVVFAAEARHRAGNAAEHTALACQLIPGLGLPEAAALARRCLPDQGDDIETYQQWRASIRAACAA